MGAVNRVFMFAAQMGERYAVSPSLHVVWETTLTWDHSIIVLAKSIIYCRVNKRNRGDLSMNTGNPPCFPFYPLHISPSPTLRQTKFLLIKVKEIICIYLNCGNCSKGWISDIFNLNVIISICKCSFVH